MKFIEITRKGKKDYFINAKLIRSVFGDSKTTTVHFSEEDVVTFSIPFSKMKTALLSSLSVVEIQETND